MTGSWAIEQIQAVTLSTPPFFDRNDGGNQRQPDLVALTLTFDADGRFWLTAPTGRHQGFWQAGPLAETIDLRLDGYVYRLTNVVRQSDTLTFRSPELTSFLGMTTYTLSLNTSR